MELVSEWCAATVVVDAPAGTAAVTLTGELDVAGVGLLRQALGAAEASRCPRVVIHAEALRFLDLTALRILIEHQDRLRARGGELELRAPRRIVRTLVQAAGVADRFTPVPPTEMSS